MGFIIDWISRLKQHASSEAAELDLTELRPAVGFGARIKLPLLSAPVRVDWGINLDPRELVPGTLERHTVLHVSLGQAF